MNIRSRCQNLLGWGSRYKNNILISVFLVLGFLIGLGFGLLTKSQKPSPIVIDKNIKIGLPIAQSGLSAESLNFTGGGFVASINGKSYYPKDCKAANVIKDENRLWFDSTKAAESQGYTPAKNCSW